MRSPPRAGLTAYGRGGELIAGGALPADVVRAAFEFSAAHDVPLCGFLGEECVTHKMHPELEELHYRWVLRCLLPCVLQLRAALSCSSVTGLMPRRHRHALAVALQASSLLCWWVLRSQWCLPALIVLP